MFMKHYAPNICEPSIEVFVKWMSNQGVGEGGGQGQSGCEQRIEFIVKIPKKYGGGSG